MIDGRMSSPLKQVVSALSAVNEFKIYILHGSRQKLYC